MNPGRLRLVMHLGGLVMAAALAVLLPFSPVVNTCLAAVFWLADGAMAEMVFNRRASTSEKIADLRDRVDNPPA